MLAERCLLYDSIIEIAITYFHHQKCLLSAYMKSISRKDIGMLAKEMYLTLVNKEVQLYLLFPKSFHSQDNTVNVRFSKNYLACLTFTKSLYHFELVSRLLLFDIPYHLQSLAHLGIYFCLLFLFTEIFLGLIWFCYDTSSKSLLEIL